MKIIVMEFYSEKRFLKIGAVVGMVMYFYGNRQVGFVVIVAAMVLKFVECILRLIK